MYGLSAFALRLVPWRRQSPDVWSQGVLHNGERLSDIDSCKVAGYDDLVFSSTSIDMRCVAVEVCYGSIAAVYSVCSRRAPHRDGYSLTRLRRLPIQ